MSRLRPLTQRTPFSSTDVVRSSVKPVKFWTAVMRGLFAQNEINESLSSDLVSVLALGDVDPLGQSGLSADVAIRRTHTNLAHASVPEMQRMLLAARAPQPILDASRTNLGETLEADGTQLLDVPGEAHEQVGRSGRGAWSLF